ncbi:energy transducer TonB [Variovorax ginsengisoli]|uniref:energy transducer TonB n=1 Tax=Variovorax ginsengisoli TaxID=363844 RepID=UPI003454DE16
MHRAGQPSPTRVAAPEPLRARLIQGRAEDRLALAAEQADAAPRAATTPADSSAGPNSEPASRRVSRNSEPWSAEPTASAQPRLEAPATSKDSAAAPLNSIRDEYLPRSQLTVAPVAQTPAILLPPLGQDDATRRTGVLSLFIDAEGRVRRVEAHEPLMPEPFEQAAREAFMGVRFSPGERDGQAVKSRIRVEVVFDGASLATP